jgi:thymidylate synthase (FAD)
LSFELRDARLQDVKNRQNSIDLISDSWLDAAWKDKQQTILNLVNETYTWAIDNGIAKEQARAVLPEGLTKSRLYVCGTIRSFIHYIEVRTEESTQKEHRELAQEVAKAISAIFKL